MCVANFFSSNFRHTHKRCHHFHHLHFWSAAARQKRMSIEFLCSKRCNGNKCADHTQNDTLGALFVFQVAFFLSCSSTALPAFVYMMTLTFWIHCDAISFPFSFHASYFDIFLSSVYRTEVCAFFSFTWYNMQKSISMDFIASKESFEFISPAKREWKSIHIYTAISLYKRKNPLSCAHTHTRSELLKCYKCVDHILFGSWYLSWNIPCSQPSST